MKNKISIENRKAYHNYFINETLECGVELMGNEVKSIKAGMCNIIESYVKIENNQLLAYGINITPWETSNRFDLRHSRSIRLLAHKQEIRKLKTLYDTDGVALIPIKVYEKQGNIKILLGVCKGKHIYDKRETIKKRDIEREIKRRHKVV